jgi:hypothetical protein
VETPSIWWYEKKAFSNSYYISLERNSKIIEKKSNGEREREISLGILKLRNSPVAERMNRWCLMTAQQP